MGFDQGIGQKENPPSTNALPLLNMLIPKSSIKLWILGGSISHNIMTVLWKRSSLTIKDGWCQALEPLYWSLRLVLGDGLDVIHSCGAGVEVSRLLELIGVGAVAIAIV